MQPSHGAFSRLFWPAAILVTLVTGLYAAWLTTPDLADLDAITMVQEAPNARWALVGGQDDQRRGYDATFAVDRTTGASRRMPTVLWWGTVFSRDGRVMAWLQPEAGALGPAALTLHTRRLDVDDARDEDRGIRATGRGLALSDDGSRAAVVDGGRIAIHDLATGKLLGAAPMPAWNARNAMFFVTPDVVRIVQAGASEGDPVRIHELDLSTRSFRQTGQSVAGLGILRSASGDGSLLFNGQRHVVDGRTVATVAMLPEWSAEGQRGRMLHDGSVVRTGRIGGAAHLQIFGRDGTLRHEAALPGAEFAFVSAATSDGKLVVAGSRWSGREVTARQTYVVDIASGKIERVLNGVRALWPAWETDARSAAYPAGADMLGTDETGRSVSWKTKGRAAARPLVASPLAG